MKIGFDAKRAFWNYTGLGNYSRSVISGMANFYPEHDFTLYSPGIMPHSELLSALSHTNIHKVDLGKGFKGDFKRALGFDFGNLDLFHGLSNELPLFSGVKKTRKVLSIHDLLFLRYPEFYPFIDRQIYKFKTIQSCKTADLIIAISEQTKQDLIHFLQIPEYKIKVHYQSCHPQFRIQKSEEEIRKDNESYGIHKPYILQVGTLETRKNALLTLNAFFKSKSKETHQLVLMGNRTPYCDQLEQFVADNRLEENVKFLYKASFSHFPSLYQGASLSVYPSLFEGFGIPILEAMISGTPVITSKDGCFKEVGAGAVLYIDPLDSLDFASKIDLVLSDQILANDLIKKGLERAEFFAPEKLMQELNDIYSSVLHLP